MKLFELQKHILKSLIDYYTPLNNPIPSPNNDALSVFVKDLSAQNISVENISNSNKYLINSSMEKTNNTDVYMSTTIDNNITSHTPDSSNNFQGMFILSFAEEANFNFLNNKLLIRII